MKIHILGRQKLIQIAVVALFFAVYISAGYLIYKDYGVSTDEQNDYLRGQLNYERFTGGTFAQFRSACSRLENVCYYPPIFSMLLYWYAPSGDTQAIYWRRHQLTFAFFVLSVFFFFLTGKKIFKDWKIGLLGSLFLIISPRIFAHSFYNPKDIPFLGAYIIAIYTLLLFLEKKNILTAILHGLATALVCGIRTPGLIIIPITFLFVFFDLLLAKARWKSYLRAGALLLASLLVTTGLVYWLTPSLYNDPVGNYIKVFNMMKQYPWDSYQLYMGQDIRAKVPWHYSIVWFSISSPIFYLILFISGSVTLVVKSLKSFSRAQFQSYRDLYLVAACAILPILAVIVEKSTLYTDNRQMYFVYPPLLLIALYGFKLLVDKIRLYTPSWRLATAILLVAGLAYPVYFMVRYHPYQYTYFNFLAGSKMSVVKERFGLDAWGVSVLDGLKYIARTDPSQKIAVRISGVFPRGWFLLPETDRQRLDVWTIQPPDYIIDTYRFYPIEKFTKGKVVYSIKVGDADILTVIKLNGN